MRIIELNHWFVDGNELSISLMNLYASIELKSLGNNKYFSLKIEDSEGKEFIILYNTLEEAIYFTENVVVNCKSIDDVTNSYGEHVKKLKR